MDRQNYRVTVELAEKFDRRSPDDLEHRRIQLAMYEPTIGRGDSNSTAISISLRGDTEPEAAEIATTLINRNANPNRVGLVKTVVVPVVATDDRTAPDPL